MTRFPEHIEMKELLPDPVTPITAMKTSLGLSLKLQKPLVQGNSVSLTWESDHCESLLPLVAVNLKAPPSRNPKNWHQIRILLNRHPTLLFRLLVARRW